jgi:hypothetical protein
MLERAAASIPTGVGSSSIRARIFAENLPMLYFAAPRLYYAHSPRAAWRRRCWAPVLWNADRLSVAR